MASPNASKHSDADDEYVEYVGTGFTGITQVYKSPKVNMHYASPVLHLGSTCSTLKMAEFHVEYHKTTSSSEKTLKIKGQDNKEDTSKKRNMNPKQLVLYTFIDRLNFTDKGFRGSAAMYKRLLQCLNWFNAMSVQLTAITSSGTSSGNKKRQNAGDGEGKDNKYSPKDYDKCIDGMKDLEPYKSSTDIDFDQVLKGLILECLYDSFKNNQYSEKLNTWIVNGFSMNKASWDGLVKNVTSFDPEKDKKMIYNNYFHLEVDSLEQLIEESKLEFSEFSNVKLEKRDIDLVASPENSSSTSAVSSSKDNTAKKDGEGEGSSSTSAESLPKGNKANEEEHLQLSVDIANTFSNDVDAVVKLKPIMQPTKTNRTSTTKIHDTIAIAVARLPVSFNKLVDKNGQFNTCGSRESVTSLVLNASTKFLAYLYCIEKNHASAIESVKGVQHMLDRMIQFVSPCEEVGKS